MTDTTSAPVTKETLLQEIGDFFANLGTKISNFVDTNPTAETVVSNVKSALTTAEQILLRNGGDLLLQAATNVLPQLLTGNWATAVANLLADAKAAGATTIPAEEQLAASLALQTAQTIAGTLAAATANPAEATVINPAPSGNEPALAATETPSESSTASDATAPATAS